MEQSAQGFVAMIKLLLTGIGMLSKAFYQKYGDEAIPVISEVMKQGGIEYGKIMQQMAPAKDMKEVSESLKMMDSMMGLGMEVTEASDKTLRFTMSRCPLGIEGTSKELCEALMLLDKNMMSTRLGQELEMSIPKSVAVGDAKCDVILSIK